MIKGCRFSGGGLWGAKGRRWTSWLTNTGFGPSAVMGIRAVRFLVWAIAAAFRPRVRLIAENLCPRHPCFSADTPRVGERTGGSVLLPADGLRIRSSL